MTVRKPPLDQTAAERLAHLHKGNQTRVTRATIRQDIRGGRTTLEDLLDKRPAAVENMMLLDLIRLLPAMGDQKLIRLNQDAIDAGMNLVVRLGDADLHLRAWLFEHCLPHARGGFVEYSRAGMSKEAVRSRRSRELAA